MPRSCSRLETTYVCTIMPYCLFAFRMGGGCDHTFTVLTLIMLLLRLGEQFGAWDSMMSQQKIFKVCMGYLDECAKGT